ncbi:MAG: chemotaxis protein CheW [Motiliproteus sp.]
MKPSSHKPEPQVQPQTVSAETTTLAPQQAVQDYLDALLSDATTQAQQEDARVLTAVVEPVVATETLPVVEITAASVATATEVVDKSVSPDSVLEPLAETITESLVETATELQTETVSSSDRWHNGYPDWAQQRFECLLFKVAGLTLAVPLVELGGVLVIEEALRPLFGQPDWFLGLLPSKTAGTVKAIDTARWVMPEKYPEQGLEDFKYVILMEGSEWGMACHSVEDAITLEPDQVRWRSDRGRRPWLAGTVIDHMCAIMDVSALMELLRQSQVDNAQMNQLS